MANAEHTTSEIGSDSLNGAADSVKRKASDVAAQARKQTQTLRDTVGAVAQDGAEAAQEMAAQTHQSVQTVTDATSETIRRNPMLAVAGALGLGVLLGLAVSRKS